MKKILDSKIFNFIFILLIIAFCSSIIIYEFNINKITIFLILFFILLDYIYVFKKELFEKIIDNFVRYRFLICLILFIGCVLFKISGSSIGMYDTLFPTKIDAKNSVVFGTARGVRSDEWVVMTPYYFSQKYNNYDVLSHQMSVDGQNMIIGYNSPVKDITVLGKPLNWGYMLLGNEYGLSWYWCMKILLMFLAAFEVCYIITKKNKKLSIVGAIMIAFAPAIQWWFAPHMPDVVLWAMVLFSFLYHFFTNQKRWVRNVLTILLPISVMQFAVALFPSFQVGLGYFIIFIFLALIFRDKIKLFENKKQIIRNIIVVIASLGLVGYFVFSNIDALKYEMNTAYPGKRVDVGGNYVAKDLFTDLGTPFLSYTGSKAPYTNQCEDSTFIHFGIFILMLSPLLIKELKKKKDRDYILGIGFISIIVLDIVFMIVGFPEIISKLTFFSYINRMKMILGFILTLFTIWGFNNLEKIGDKIDNKYYYLAIFAYSFMLLSFIDGNLMNYLPRFVYYIEIIIYAFMLFLIKQKRFNYGYVSLIGLVLFSSIVINPINIGSTSITNHPSSTKIQEIVQQDKDAYWIGYENIVYPSYLLANGAKTFNAVNFYPDFGKWNKIDDKNEFNEIYNRYAHIVTSISLDGQDHVNSYTTPDTLKLDISLHTMKEFYIKYVLTNQDLSNIKENKLFLEEIYSDNDIKIYQLKENN